MSTSDKMDRHWWRAQGIEACLDRMELMGARQAVRKALMSLDLYQVLLDVQNGIDSPGLKSMANSAIQTLDKGRAELYAQEVTTPSAERQGFDDTTPNLSEAEKVWCCRNCGVEQDSSGPVTPAASVADTKPVAWLNADRVNVISEVERAKMEKGPFTWALEKHWKDATPLYASASSVREQEASGLSRVALGECCGFPDDCLHGGTGCAEGLEMKLKQTIAPASSERSTKPQAAWVDGVCKTCCSYTHSCKCEHASSDFLRTIFAAPQEGAGSTAGPAANGEPAAAAPTWLDTIPTSADGKTCQIEDVRRAFALSAIQPAIPRRPEHARPQQGSTPRTDAWERALTFPRGHGNVYNDAYFACLDFARQLERELNAANSATRPSEEVVALARTSLKRSVRPAVFEMHMLAREIVRIADRTEAK